MRRGESGKAFVDQMASLPLRDSHPGTKLPKKSQQNIFNCSKAQYKGEQEELNLGLKKKFHIKRVADLKVISGKGLF